MRRNPALDILRCVAILLVLGWHFPVPDPSRLVAVLAWPWRGFGWAGVDLFFVLSGFLVGGLLMAEKQKSGAINLGRFYERRAFKIWPSYYVLIAVFLVNRIRRHETIKPLIGNLLNIQNYTGTPLSHTWSLAVEEHFYLLLGLVLLLLARKNAIGVRSIFWVYIGSFVISMGSRIVMAATGQDGVAVHWFTNCRLDSLCLGVLLAALYHFKSPIWDRLTRSRWALVGVVLVGLCALRFSTKYGAFMLTVGLWLVALGSAAVLILLFTADRQRPLGRCIWSKGGGVLAWVGERSYGTYLWHTSSAPVVLWVYHKVQPHSILAAYTLAAVVWIGAAIVMGDIAHRLVEGPFLKLRDRIRPRVATAIEV